MPIHPHESEYTKELMMEAIMESSNDKDVLSSGESVFKEQMNYLNYIISINNK